MSVQIMHLVGIDAGVLRGVDHAARGPSVSGAVMW